MSILSSIVYLTLGILIVLSTRMVTTTLHELGHALPALLYTNGPVKVYVGSYGDEKNSMPVSLGRLQLYFKWKITEWNLGVCVHQVPSRLLDNLLIILGGPLASLIFGGLLITWVLLTELEPTPIFLLTFFIVSAVWDFFTNIIPHDRPLPMFDGSLCYNDGYQLRQLWRSAKYPPAYTKALEYLAEKNYSAAIPELQSILDEGIQDREIYRLLARTYEQNQEAEKVLRTMTQMMEHHKLQPEDQGLVAAAYQQRGQYAQAIHFYNQALYIDFRNPHLLYHRGLAQLESGDYQEALQDFSTALSHGAKSAELHANLGLVLLRLRQLALAKEQLDLALALDPEVALTHLHLTFYYQQTGENDIALEYLDRAEKIGSTYHGLAYLREELSN